MGTFSVEIEIGDSARQQWVTMDALVDTGATMTSAPASILHNLGVEPMDRRNFRFAQGEVRTMEIGYTWVRFAGKEVLTQVLFNEEGAPPVVGQLTLDVMLLEFDPDTQTFIQKVGLLPSFWPVRQEKS